MKQFDKESGFYYEVINLIDLDHYETAIKLIKNHIYTLNKPDDIALAYINCGFLSDKLGDHISAIDYFSKSISIESKLDFMNNRSKNISYSGRSNSRYKHEDYLGAIEDKRKAKKIRLIEIKENSDFNNYQIDYKNILLGNLSKTDLEAKYLALMRAASIKKSKYDLIRDYKKVISKKRREEVIKTLETLSESKYKIGDFKGSIKAIRRAEKYY